MIPGLLLILLSFDFVVGHPYWCVAILTLSLGLTSTSTVTNDQNAQDLAPNYAGIIFSIINFVGTSSGFLAPMVVEYFTREGVSDHLVHLDLFI